MKYFNRSSQSLNLGKILQCWENLGMFRFQDLEITFLQPLLQTHSCLHVSFSKAAIIKSKAEQMFNLQIVKSVTSTFFFGWEFGCLEDKQKPVWSNLSKNQQKLPCKETGIVQPPKQVHMSSRCPMRDKRHTYRFLFAYYMKGVIWFGVWFKHWKGFKLEVKLPFFSCKMFYFWKT